MKKRELRWFVLMAFLASLLVVGLPGRGVAALGVGVQLTPRPTVPPGTVPPPTPCPPTSTPALAPSPTPTPTSVAILPEAGAALSGPGVSLLLALGLLAVGAGLACKGWTRAGRGRRAHEHATRIRETIRPDDCNRR